MQKFLKKVLRELLWKSRVSATVPESDQQAMRVIPWFRDNGDKTHRLNYELDESSIVFDLGGYEGQWASDIFSMYQCRIYIFEPLPAYAANISTRFRANHRISVHSYGLAAEDQQSALAVNGDASSVHKTGQEVVAIRLISTSRFIAENKIDTIDLMKINIEGAEYDLLTYLIKSGLVNRIKNIQVQFHDFVPDAEIRMLEIQKQLSVTHELTYQYSFVWENWALKKQL
jgi:FkbM family methyltransferase